MPKKKSRCELRSTSPSRPRAAASDTRSAIDSMLDDFVICRSAASPEQAVDEAGHVKPLFVFLVGSHGAPKVRWTEVLRGPRGASTLPSTTWWSERHGRFSASWFSRLSKRSKTPHAPRHRRTSAPTPLPSASASTTPRRWRSSRPGSTVTSRESSVCRSRAPDDSRGGPRIRPSPREVSALPACAVSPSFSAGARGLGRC